MFLHHRQSVLQKDGYFKAEWAWPERWKEHKRKSNKRTAQAWAKIRRERIKWLQDYKMERGCCQCGYRGHPAALTFDHLDRDTKKFEVNNYNCLRNMSVLEDEIAKCRILCANCHNVHSYVMEHWRPKHSNE